jgi:O-antigen ligase
MSSLYLSTGMVRAKYLMFAVAGTAFSFLILTGSRTAFGALLVTMVIWWAMTASKPKKFMLASCIALGIGIFAFGFGLGLVSVTTDWLSMGRQDGEVDSLSSRLPLWLELFNNYAARRAIVGFGYGSFWSPERINDVARTQGWSPGYAHSTYLDLILNVGIVGAALFVVTMILAFITALRLEGRNRNAGFGFIAMFIAYLLLNGILETLIGNASYMSIFAISATCLLLATQQSDDEPLTAEAAATDLDCIFDSSSPCAQRRVTC